VSIVVAGHTIPKSVRAHLVIDTTAVATATLAGP
jgi:hypothetical protein